MKKVFTVLFLLWLSSLNYGQENTWGITAYGGLAIPTQDFGKYYDNGYTFAAGAIYDFKYSTRVAITIGYTAWDLNKDEFNKSLEQDSIRFDGTAPVKAIPLLLQIKWFGTQERLKLYGLVEAGFYFTKSEFNGDVFIADTLAGRISGKKSSTNTGINLGIGLTYDLSEKLEIDVSGKYHIVSVKSTYNFSGITQSGSINSDQYWSVSAGINIILFD